MDKPYHETPLRTSGGSRPSPSSVHPCIEGGDGSPLPCLNSNNKTGKTWNPPPGFDLPFESLTGIAPRELSPYHRKAVFVLTENISRYIDQTGLDRVGFLTLTFPDNVKHHKEAYRRFNIMTKHLFPRIFGATWTRTSERQSRGAWHFHCLVDCKQDIRTGVNFDEIYGKNGHRRKYTSASPYLRSLWQELRNSLPAYGFGRAELLPIQSTVEAMSKYIGKYLCKANMNRPEADKGVRLVGYSKDFLRSSPKIAWNSPGSKEWRRKLEIFATKTGSGSLEGLKDDFGPRWAYFLKDHIDDADNLTPLAAYRLLATFKDYEERSPWLDNLKPKENGWHKWVEQKRDPSGLLTEYDQESGALVDHFTGEVLF